MTLDQPRRTPYHWWGDAWATRNALSLDQLVEQGTISPYNAKDLQSWVALGESVVIGAERSGVGKSTLAFALLDSIPFGRSVVHIRGSHERFDWAKEIDEQSLTLLVNEISPHLPVYLWGVALSRTATLVANGAQLIATAHPDGLHRLLIELGQPVPFTCAPVHIVTLGDSGVVATTAPARNKNNVVLPV